MVQRVQPRRKDFRPYRKGIARPGDGCARKIKRVLTCVADDFDCVGVEQRVDVRDAAGAGGDRRSLFSLKKTGDGINKLRVDQRFISLNIDHYGLFGQVEYFDYFGKTVGAAGMVRACENGFKTMLPARRQHAGRVSGDDYTACS